MTAIMCVLVWGVGVAVLVELVGVVVVASSVICRIRRL